MRKFIVISLLLAVCYSAFAVTKEEMEKARVISAKIYLRWANNGSDYLEKLDPANISQLEGDLRDKEKTNLKAFKQIPVPSGYESWTKDQLVEYWGTTALNAKGLNADGVRGGARTQIRAKLKAMKVSDPAPAAAATPVEEKKDTVEAVSPQRVEEVAAAEALLQEEAPAESLAEAESIAVEESPKKKSSGTWIYIVALLLLVIAVIALVMFASKTMKNNTLSGTSGNGNAPVSPSAGNAVISAGASSDDEIRRMREKFAESLAQKQEEIRILNRQVTDLTEENKSLASRLERLQLRLDAISEERSSKPHVASPRVSYDEDRSAEYEIERRDPEREEPRSEVRRIFLGRVNANGVFVRADRTLNPGNSIYMLVTPDGFSGSFRVYDDPSVFETGLRRPIDMLSGGCICKDFSDTVGCSCIVTDNAGTAIFEDNCWRVIRKAKIHYE